LSLSFLWVFCLHTFQPKMPGNKRPQIGLKTFGQLYGQNWKNGAWFIKLSFLLTQQQVFIDVEYLYSWA